MGKKNKIEPLIILSIDFLSITNIPMVVRTISGDILEFRSVYKIKNQYKVRQDVIKNIEELKTKYNIDTILMDQNKLFIDKIDRHPDPYVLHNVLLYYGVEVSILDRFYNTIDHILALPDWEWKKHILGNIKYSFDLYKAHVKEQEIYADYIKTIDYDNYYRVVCLSESVNFTELIDKQYKLNKGE